MDKSIVIGIVLALLLPTISILWFAMRSRIMNEVEDKLEIRDEKHTLLSAEVSKNTIKITHIDSTLSTLTETIKTENEKIIQILKDNNRETKEMIERIDGIHREAENNLWKEVHKKADKK